MPLEAHPDRANAVVTHSHLEAIGRLFCGLSPWLNHSSNAQYLEGLTAAGLNQLFENIVSPDSPDFLNFQKGTQPLVDAAFLATGFLRAPQLWQGLQPEVQSQLIASLRSSRSIRPHFNNWLLFAGVIEAFFCKFDLEWDAMRIDYPLRQHEQWYLGDGVYGDGPEFHLDYYNSFVIHPLLLEILWAVRGKHAGWDRLYDRVLARAQRHAVQLERLIGPDGTFPPIGRSLTYRCGAFHLLALLAWKGLLPGELKPAQVRGALLAVMDKTLTDRANFDDQGWLRVGVNGSQPTLGENYISTGSLYLCSTAFLPLGLAEDDPFWSAPEEPWTQRKLWWRHDAISIDKALKL